MWFETKRALLEYLGKNPKDNKLVDRLILRGEVYVEEGMYYIVDKDSRIKELEAKIFSLEKEEGKNTWLEHSDGDLRFISKAMGEKVLAHGEINKLKQELEEAKIQWEYYKERCEKYKKAINLVIHETYVVAKAKLGNKMEEEAEFREAILGKVREQLWE